MDPVATARAAPLLELPLLESPQAAGVVLDIARIVTTPTSDHLAWIETTDGRILRLPEVLHAWAYDTVAIALTMGSPFPSQVEFGIVGGRAYAQIL